jgi:signal transduction histidine kinase
VHTPDLHADAEAAFVAEIPRSEATRVSPGSDDEELHARAAELTTLARHLLLVAEEEKAELARELHDTFGSNLTAINMDLNWIARRLPDERPELRERLQRALRMLGETVAIKQEVIDRLRPSQLDTLGLAVALRTHCRELANRFGLNCDVEAPEDFDGLDRTSSIALYRVALEALSHVEPRAGANVRIDVAREDQGVRLRIRDDGPGLALAMSASPGREGLVGMRERVRAVGGTLQMTVGENGAVVDAFVPEYIR